MNTPASRRFLFARKIARGRPVRRWSIGIFLFLFAVLSTGFAEENEVPAPAKLDVSVRSTALQLAGAFSNDGYKIRDGAWSGELEPGRPEFLEVNLFAGNEYWFEAAVVPPARKLAVSIFDADGKPVAFQTYAGGCVAAAGIVPKISGRYLIKLSLLEGEKSPFCLLYSYK